MKKLLALLFTLVLFVTVGNINTNNVKAEENAEYLKQGEYYPIENAIANDFNDALKAVSGGDVSLIKEIVFTSNAPITTDVDFSVSSDIATGSFDSATGKVTINCGNSDIRLNINCKKMFHQLTNLEVIDFGGIVSLPTSNQINMNGMYELCPKLKEIKNFKSYDTSGIINMGHLFNGCSSLKIVIDPNGDPYTPTNLAAYNTGLVTDMAEMFQGCAAIEELDFTKASSFLTREVTDMNGMFNDCSNLVKLNVSTFDTKKVTDMSRMFGYCHKLSEIIGLFKNNFVTDQVKSMWSMFSQDYSLTTIDISNINVNKLENSKEMFNGCLSLTRIYSNGNQNFISVTDSTHMFYGCVSLVGGKGTAYEYDEDQEPELSDKTRAVIDKPDIGTPGYFTDIDSVFNDEAKLQPNGYYTVNGQTLDGIYYDDTTKTLTFSGLVMDSSYQDTLQIPSVKDLKIVVTGVNSIVNTNDNPEAFIADNGNITFEGDGTLTIAYLNKGAIILRNEDTITINGPTVNLYGTYTDEGHEVLGTNQLIMKKGMLNLKGNIGLILSQNKDTSPLPKLVVNGGTIKLYGLDAALLEQLQKDSPVKINANVKGSVNSFDDLSNVTLKPVIQANDYLYSYFIDDDVVRYIEITKKNNPSPDPGKKDESCEKVIGPTWHWNNTKGICEEYSTVGTYTR